MAIPRILVTLRQRLLRLGAQRPELRPDLRRLLRTSANRVEKAVWRVLDEYEMEGGSPTPEAVAKAVAKELGQSSYRPALAVAKRSISQTDPWS